ncbi:hypothetical protein Phum_PHUM511990 [Pediculus humanus corporis]|uniref:Receptor expression-enhancing protein n=1 Tax=Pediculus humanus subsp. corporis TaxID=121224 RepID=E0VYA0_PEDHC|nr:uncharacterized protein Phum_PHUM511990 [Pediculus humanus corporis]EEB18356.1 hypothetical protein Phum_PHUM511990 [Pediculus humanus corporis]
MHRFKHFNSSLVCFCLLLFGTLYPAYSSYKAVRTKNVKEYVKWMMYWIVFALFTSIETITDLFFSFWFPFYYELKIITVIYLLSPATNGSSILYRKFVHPVLTKREQYLIILKTKFRFVVRGKKKEFFFTVVDFKLCNPFLPQGIPQLNMTPSSDLMPRKSSEFQKDLVTLEEEDASDDLTKDDENLIMSREDFPNLKTEIIWMKNDGINVDFNGIDSLVEKSPVVTELHDQSDTDLKNNSKKIKVRKGGGGLVSHLKKSYSLSDLSGEKPTLGNNYRDEVDHQHYEGSNMKQIPENRIPGNFFPGANYPGLYYAGSDVDFAGDNHPPYGSGYSSGDPLYNDNLISRGDHLVRTASLGGTSRIRTRAATKAAGLSKRSSLTEENTAWSEEEVIRGQINTDNFFLLPLSRSSSNPCTFTAFNHMVKPEFQHFFGGISQEQIIALVNSSNSSHPIIRTVDASNESENPVNDKNSNSKSDNANDSDVRIVEVVENDGNNTKVEMGGFSDGTKNEKSDAEVNKKESSPSGENERSGKYKKKKVAPSPPFGEKNSSGKIIEMGEIVENDDDDEFGTPNSSPELHRKKHSSSYSNLVEEMADTPRPDKKNEKTGKKDNLFEVPKKKKKSKEKKKTKKLHLPKMSFSFWNQKSNKNSSESSENSSIASFENGIVPPAEKSKNDLEYFIPLKGDTTNDGDKAKENRTE